jgi:O-antigen/teichoic acid export membrane protein
MSIIIKKTMSITLQDSPVEKEEESLTKTASRGAFWALTSNIAVSAISFVGTAILARILDPKDFGLLGMAVLVTGIVQLFGNLGLGGALVQKKDASQESLSTVFWVNVIAGSILTIICVAAAPLAAMFFRETAVKNILILLSCTFLISALSSIHSTLIYKEIRMKRLAVIEIVGRLLRVGIMLIAAFCGLKFWSIVIGMIVERVFKTIGFFIALPWKPSLVFSKEKFKEFFKFGRNLFGDGFLNYLNQNMDFIVTGRVLGVSLLGFYQMAYNLPFLVRGYINDSIGSVSFPVFCKVQDDHDRLVRGYLRIVKFIAMVTFPLLAGLAFCSEDFIRVVYGPKWLPAAQPLQILCFGAMLASVHTVITPLLNAKGRPDLSFKWNCVRLPLTIIAIFIGAKINGIVGVAFGMLIIEILSIILIIITFRLIQQNIKNYFISFFPSVMGCLTMVIILCGIRTSCFTKIALLRFTCNVFIGIACYFASIFLAFRNEGEEFIKYIQQTFKNRR